jgi:hypothetical protein
MASCHTCDLNPVKPCKLTARCAAGLTVRVGTLCILSLIALVLLWLKHMSVPH